MVVFVAVQITGVINRPVSKVNTMMPCGGDSTRKNVQSKVHRDRLFVIDTVYLCTYLSPYSRVEKGSDRTSCRERFDRVQSDISAPLSVLGPTEFRKLGQMMAMFTFSNTFTGTVLKELAAFVCSDRQIVHHNNELPARCRGFFAYLCPWAALASLIQMHCMHFSRLMPSTTVLDILLQGSASSRAFYIKAKKNVWIQASAFVALGVVLLVVIAIKRLTLAGRSTPIILWTIQASQHSSNEMQNILIGVEPSRWCILSKSNLTHSTCQM